MIYNNSFYNFYYIVKNNYSERMTYHYGYCHHSGYGFIKNIYEKYKLNKNVTTINYIQKPNSEWFFYKPNVKFYEDKINTGKYYFEKILPRAQSHYIFLANTYNQ